MSMRFLRPSVLAAGVMLAAALPAFGQDSATLADIRSQLGRLYADINAVRGELTATGQLANGVVGNTPLERLNAIEAELTRLTSKTEELEFRINRLTVDGTNRIGDLEFRICELEAGCDIGMLGDTPSLGGVDSAAQVPAPSAPVAAGPVLTASEQADYQRAQEALAQGDFRSANDRFASFIAAYPGGPMTSQALFHRGEALEGLGQISDAARAYLDSFSGDPSGEKAPDALFKLGTSLAALGETRDACVTLGEVLTRFPAKPAAELARAERTALGCQ